MLNDIDKSKLSFEKYIKLKKKVTVKSYTERFKWVDKFLYVFSWFGNAVSIFLAFFFLQMLFYSSFAIVGKSIWITIGIIFFLTLFELLKRYVFGMFSIEVIKQKNNLFKTSMISFIIGTSILIIGSFYFSLNGAKDFVDNQKFFENKTQTILTSKVDSVQNIFFKQKEIYINDNKNLRETNNILRNKLAETPSNYRTIRKEYQDNINNNISLIDKNQIKIDEIDNDMNIKIQELKESEKTILSSKLSDNKKNKLAFIIISSLIEMIIMLGVYYDKLYEYRSIEEYEESVINTQEFKMWYKYNHLLEIIFNSVNNVGDKIPTSDNIIELSKISKNPISKGELDKFIKLLYYLEIIIKDGNKRIINLTELESKNTLRNYFKIN